MLTSWLTSSFLTLLGFLIVVFIILWFLRSLFPKKQYGVKSVTRRGEPVKSIGEKKIADYFNRNNINYVYEKEVRTRSIFLGKKISNPDFYLPDYNVYVEYWGLVNADDYRTRTNYVRTMKYKMAKYHQNKIRFVSIYPDNLDNLDWIFRAKFRKVTGIDLPN